MITKHLRLYINFHVTIADTPPLLPEGMIEPPDPEYDARQARLLETVKNNPEVLKQWILGMISLEMGGYSWELADMIMSDKVSLQDILAPALQTLSADDQEYFDETIRLEVFDECTDMFKMSFTVKEDPMVVVEQEQNEIEVPPELAAELDSARAEIAAGEVRDFQEYQQKKCSTCHGYGLWAMGDPSPMGTMDAEDGYSTRSCPECGANANPIETAEETNE